MTHRTAPPRAHGHAVAASGQRAVKYGTKSRPWAVGAEAPPSAPAPGLRPSGASLPSVGSCTLRVRPNGG